jgi:hypothetical protein
VQATPACSVNHFSKRSFSYSRRSHFRRSSVFDPCPTLIFRRSADQRASVVMSTDHDLGRSSLLKSQSRLRGFDPIKLDTASANLQLNIRESFMRLIRSDTLDQLGLRQIHRKWQKKLETFFASSRIYLSKGAVEHLLMKLLMSRNTLFSRNSIR